MYDSFLSTHVYSKRQEVFWPEYLTDLQTLFWAVFCMGWGSRHEVVVMCVSTESWDAMHHNGGDTSLLASNVPNQIFERRRKREVTKFCGYTHMHGVQSAVQISSAMVLQQAAKLKQASAHTSFVFQRCDFGEDIQGSTCLEKHIKMKRYEYWHAPLRFPPPRVEKWCR